MIPMYEVTQGVQDVILKRKSVRDFIERDVEPEKKQAIYDAILAAPTTENMMMYTVIAVTDPEVRAKLSRQPAMRKAPMILVFCADYRRWYDVFCKYIDPVRVPAEGDMLLAQQDTLVAAQTTVIAAESLGIGSCYIGDILENYEIHQKLLNLPKYVIPTCMVVFGYPTQQQKDREKPRRAAMKHVVHENGYRTMDAAELEEMLTPRCGERGFIDWMKAFCNRKFNSEFSREMTRSVGVYLKDFED